MAYKMSNRLLMNAGINCSIFPKQQTKDNYIVQALISITNFGKKIINAGNLLLFKFLKII